MSAISDDLLRRAIESIKAQYENEYDDFIAGDCHTLAAALYQAMDRFGEKGSLHACIREFFDENGELYMSGYSHMVYGSPSGACWDINGSEADVRWEEYLDVSDGPDEDGLICRLRWEEVPFEDHVPWLQERYGAYDLTLTTKVADATKEFLIETNQKSSPSGASKPRR